MKKLILYSTIILLLIIILVGINILYIFNYIPHRKYHDADFNIKTYISNVDYDNDSIDDQTDILEGVRNYIKTKPKYQSKYYETGYPNDEYGVCTDVVAYGLLNAGYDLKELVYKDIINNRDKYDIDVIDKNIDFRRVVNLLVYFNNNAIKLTNDIKKIDEWQGGDIVIFPHHIAIVSNNRNRYGIPFIIHHASNYQSNYEEDILKYYKVIGHFRIS